MSLKYEPAQVLAIRALAQREKRVLFIVPFVAIVQEKVEFLRQVTPRFHRVTSFRKASKDTARDPPVN